jgi:hypothetical protein
MDVVPESENADPEIQTLTDSPAFINIDHKKKVRSSQQKCQLPSLPSPPTTLPVVLVASIFHSTAPPTPETLDSQYYQ